MQSASPIFKPYHSALLKQHKFPVWGICTHLYIGMEVEFDVTVPAV